jgi:WD40 repeat protein
VAGEPGGLPLMSTALLSLWERRDGRRLTLAAYRELGGVPTAVARLAETAFGRLTPTQQSIARRTLLRLAETGEGGEPVRRRVPIAEVAPAGDVDARTVLDTLAARRLLTVSDSHAEVAHEALLREWPRLQNWLDEDEAGRKLRRHLAPAALGWQASGDAGELYRGSRLTGALDWLRDHPDDLTEVEHDFLRAGQEAAEAEAFRRRRSIRRLRALAVGLAIVGALALVVSLVAVNLRSEADRSSLRADVRALQVRAVNEPRLDRALLFAAQAHLLQPSDESRWALLQTVQRSPEATAIFYANQSLQTVAASADGTRVVASGFEGALYVWDTESRQRMTIPDAAIFVKSLDISPDGRHIAVVGVPVANLEPDPDFDSEVVLIDMEQSPPSVNVLTGAEPSSARFADGRTIVTVGEDGRVRYVDMQTGHIVRTLDFELPEETALVDTPENRRFMVAAAEPENRGRVLVWEVETGLEVWSSDESDSAVVSISPDGSKLVIGHADGQIERVDLNAGGDRTPVPSALEDGLVDVAFSPDGSTFAGVTQEQTVVVWDARTLEERAVLRGHADQVTQAVYSPDGKTIYVSALDRMVLAWHWNPTGTKGVVADHGGRPGPGMEGTALAADGSVAATRYADGRVEVFDVATGASFEVEVPGEVDWLAVERLGRYVQVVTNQPTHVTVNVIDVQRRALLPHTFTLERQTAYAAEFTWDGHALVTAAEDRIDLWDLATGEQRSANLYQATNGVPTIGVHPNGRLVALGEGGGAIEVIDLATGKLEASLDPGAAERFAVVPLFSPDGRWLAASFENGRVVIWDTRSWDVHSVMEADGSLVFSPDSRILFADGAIWSIDGDLLGSISGVDSSVGISDDGSTMVTFTERGIRSWNIAPDRLLEHSCTVAGRNLTQPEWSNVLPDRQYERTCSDYPDG